MLKISDYCLIRISKAKKHLILDIIGLDGMIHTENMIDIISHYI